jgi:hypothetical protein
MKKLSALFVAVALFAPSFAQKVTLSPGTHPRPKATIVAPAITPILLHTGKPITADEKKQLLASAIKAYAAQVPKAKFKMPVSLPTTPPLLTTDNMVLNGVGYGMANQPSVVDYYNGYIAFNPGVSGSYNSLILFINVQPNTAYLIIPKVFSPSTENPQITISAFLGTGGTPTNQTFTGSMGNNEFAYAFTSNSSGYVQLQIWSPNSFWNFLSCEITATPMM